MVFASVEVQASTVVGIETAPDGGKISPNVAALRVAITFFKFKDRTSVIFGGLGGPGGPGDHFKIPSQGAATLKGKLRSNPPFGVGLGTGWGRFEARNRRCLDPARCKYHRINTPLILG